MKTIFIRLRRRQQFTITTNIKKKQKSLRYKFISNHNSNTNHACKKNMDSKTGRKKDEQSS